MVHKLNFVQRKSYSSLPQPKFLSTRGTPNKSPSIWMISLRFSGVFWFYQVSSFLSTMFSLWQHLYRSTPKLQLCDGTVCVMMLIYSLVTNRATTSKKVQAKESVHFALWTTLVTFFLWKFVKTSNQHLKELNPFFVTFCFLLKLYKLKEKQCKTLEAPSSIGQPLSSKISLFWKFKVPSCYLWNRFPKETTMEFAPWYVLTPCQFWSSYGKYLTITYFYKFVPPH